jgi:hypothetical protein
LRLGLRATVLAAQQNRETSSGNGKVTRLDEDHGLLLDEGMMGAQVRTLYPRPFGVDAVLISKGSRKHENLFSTPVLVWNESLTSGPMDKGRPFVAHRME